MTFPCRLSVAALAASSFAFLAGAPQVMADGTSTSGASTLLMTQIKSLIEPLHGAFGATASPTALPGASLQSVGTANSAADNIRFNLSAGINDTFSVGTQTSIGSSATSSTSQGTFATVDSTFGIAGTTINQFIGSSSSSSLSESVLDSAQQSAMSKAEEISKAQTSESTFQYREASTSINGSSSGWWWWNNNQWSQRTFNTTQVSKSTELATLQTSLRSEIKAEVYQQEFSREVQSIQSSGVISGSFEREGDTNNVEVRGIGADNTVVGANQSVFQAQLTGSEAAAMDNALGTVTGQASAVGSVNTDSTASATTSQFVNAFATAF
jgi:hypothetical protein